MNELSDADSVSRDGMASRPPASDESRRLLKREYNRRYRERHPEQNAAIRRKWVEANRDRIRESNRRWRAENIERARQLNRLAARRAALRLQRDAEQRARGQERVKQWRESHPDEVRGYHAQWVARNREKIREYSARYYETHRDEINDRATARRDANPERTKQWRKAWAERNKDRLVELQRDRRKDPDIYQAQLKANAAARRLKRQLQNAGLPPKQVHPVTAAERRAHDRAAEMYFRDPSLAEHVRQSAAFTETLTAHLRAHEPQMREFAAAYVASRTRLGLPLVGVEEVTYARAVDIVLGDLEGLELLTSRDVAGAVRSSRAILRREQRDRQSEQLLRAVVAHAHNRRDRLELDVEIENRARVQRGRPRAQTDVLLVQLALQEVVERVPTNRLSIENIRGVCRAARARIVTPSDADSRGTSRIGASTPGSQETLA
jgi:hypothetical protein